MATPYEDRLKELMEVREALQTSEQRHRAILETAVNAIITINERGIIDSINSSTVQMFGYTSEELVGKNISVLMPSPYREGHDGYLQNYKETGVRKIIGIGRETVAQRKDGSVFPIDLSIGEVVLPQGTFFTGIIRDITERKRLEQEILDISEKEQQRIGFCSSFTLYVCVYTCIYV
jgi:PAS domain S-box-containing protein